MLVDRETMQEVVIGQSVITFRGEAATVTDICEDRGRIYLKFEDSEIAHDFYPQVINCDFD